MIPGASALPWESYRARIESATLDAPLGHRPDDDVRAGRLQKVDDELAALENRSEELEKSRKKARDAEDASLEALPDLDRSRPSPLAPLLFTGFTLLIFLGDAAFTFQAIADSVGLDTSDGLSNAPTFTTLLVVVIAILAVLANAWAGVKATDRDVPLRRIGGWVMLIACAIVVGILRGAVAADGTFAMTLFGFVIPVVAGLAAGESHHRVMDYLGEREKFQRESQAFESAHGRHTNRVVEIDGTLGENREKVERLAAEAAELRNLPAAVGAESEERGRLLAARLAAARYIYDLGCTLAGRKHQITDGKEDSDA